MNSKIAGMNLSTNTKNKIWWIKLGIALIISNVFFFVLFSKTETNQASSSIPAGWVEIQVRGELLTPFHSGKKVLLLHRQGRKRIEAMLENLPSEPEGRFTVLVKESEAESLLRYETWEIVPFLKMLSFARFKKGVEHEIRY